MKSCILFLLFFFLIGCSSHKFAKESVFVDDVDEYFNPALKINVWTYMNFYPRQEGEKTGVRLYDLYPLDKEILRHVKLRGNKSKILFSAIPYQRPKYNLIAVHHRKELDTLGFNRMVGIDKSYYFQKDILKDSLDIRHILIPYGNKETLSLVYYIKTEMHLDCPFCKLDYLARINTFELQKGQKYSPSWRISECGEGNFKEQVIPLPEPLKNYKGMVYLKVFKDYGHTTGLQYFKVVNPQTEKSIKINLCKNKYFIEFQNDKENLLYRDSLQIL